MAQQEQRAGKCLQTLPAVASQNSQKHQLTYTLQASLGALFFSDAFVYTAIGGCASVDCWVQQLELVKQPNGLADLQTG